MIARGAPMKVPTARHPRSEASALLPEGHQARVLEPSPPSNADPEWFADDPTDPGGATGTLVTPIPGEGVLWTDLAFGDTRLAAYAADHWLGSYRRLADLPAGFRTTRRALHQIAFFAVAPKRYAETGKLGLRYTQGGFGTPFFGADAQVRIEGDLLIHQRGDRVAGVTISTVRNSAAFLGISYEEEWFAGFHDPLTPVGPDVPLYVDPASATALGDWFGFATSVLEEARRTPGAEDVGRVQLWPEHFDPAFEMGSLDKGHRASYGASPGDEAHEEPYLYVAAWGEIDRSNAFWNDDSFNGASLSYQALLSADDQRQTALAFIREGFDLLTG
jgi:hypothetical protein